MDEHLLFLQPIIVKNHQLNVQPKESKKDTKAPASSGAAGGEIGVGIGGLGGEGGGRETVARGLVSNSAYGLSDITVSMDMNSPPANPTHHRPNHQASPAPPITSMNASATIISKPNFKVRHTGVQEV